MVPQIGKGTLSNVTTRKVRRNRSKDKCTTIDKYNPIYMCEHALKADHKCVYAICNKCKLEMDEMHHDNNGCSKATRSTFRNVVKNNINDGRGFKRAMTNKYASRSDPRSDINKCDHTLCNLKPHYDTSYYEETYLIKQKTQETPFPFACAKCRKEIRKK